MVAIRHSREPIRPPETYLKLIDDCATRAKPDEESLAAWAEVFAKNARARLASDLDIVAKHADKSASLGEFGAIPLLLTLALHRLGYQITGIDLKPERFGRVIEAEGLNVIKCDIERDFLPIGDGFFDVVIFNELFEHLRIDLIHTMREVRRVLKPGGLLLLSSPNLRSLHGLLNFLLRNRSYSCEGDIYGQYQKLRGIGHMGHVREYTTREVIEFLARMDFRVEHLIFRGDYGPHWQKLAAKCFRSLCPFVTYVARAV